MHKTQPILHGYLITIWQSMSTTLVFAQPHGACKTFNLHSPKPVVTCNPYKVAMLKHLKYGPILQADIATLVHHTADFGWCTTYQEDISSNPLGSRASTVMITSGYNDCTQADLHTNQAALLFLQMQLKHIWHHQMQFCVITKHEALLDALCQLFKTDAHNPQWWLNHKLGDTPVHQPQQQHSQH
jgi:hypothetical protein